MELQLDGKGQLKKIIFGEREKFLTLRHQFQVP